MRKVGDLMKELGFREDGSDEVKKAFIKNLIRAAYGVEVQSSKKTESRPLVKQVRAGEQLSFFFENEERTASPKLRRRKSG